MLDACLLDDDLTRLSDGDETLAGSDGAYLSGGQKQRIVSDNAVQHMPRDTVYEEC